MYTLRFVVPFIYLYYIVSKQLKDVNVIISFNHALFNIIKIILIIFMLVHQLKCY